MVKDILKKCKTSVSNIKSHRGYCSHIDLKEKKKQHPSVCPVQMLFVVSFTSVFERHQLSTLATCVKAQSWASEIKRAPCGWTESTKLKPCLLKIDAIFYLTNSDG